MVAILIVSFFAWIAALFVLTRVAAATHRRRADAVRGAFQLLGAEPQGQKNVFAAQVRGLAVTCEFRSLAMSNGQTQSLTLCTVHLAYAPVVELDLRPQTRTEQHHIAHGRAIDVVFGDPSFDEAFVVEAAPSAIVRQLLDAPTRAVLVVEAPCHLQLVGQELRFKKEGFVDSLPRVRRLVETIVSLGARLAELPAQIEETRVVLAAHAETAGYRGASPATAAALTAPGNDAAELAAVRVARVRRQQWQAKTLLGLLATFVVGLVALRACSSR
jgi:hypothetical protein